jgi:hypothetical protein
MITIREQSDELLILGPPRLDEFIALFLFALGLFSLSLIFLGITQQQSHDVEWIAILLIVQNVGPLGILGGIVLFLQDKFIMERPTRTLLWRRPLRGMQTFRFDDIGAVAIGHTSASAGKCILILKSGVTIKLGSGGLTKCHHLAGQLSRFLEVPLEPRYVKADRR